MAAHDVENVLRSNQYVAIAVAVIIDVSLDVPAEIAAFDLQAQGTGGHVGSDNQHVANGAAVYHVVAKDDAAAVTAGNHQAGHHRSRDGHEGGQNRGVVDQIQDRHQGQGRHQDSFDDRDGFIEGDGVRGAGVESLPVASGN